jgi:hypothetical protein
VNLLLTTDLHLSDQPRDARRFGLFKWLAKQQEKHAIDATLILGDITERKDRHSSLLVNRTVEELLRLKPPVYILRGNHDGIDPNSPYFKFLNCIEGLQFVVQPTFNEELGIAFIPHCSDQATFDRACAQMPPKPRLVVLHNTFQGARAETGATLSGLSTSPIEALKPRLGAYSGDVHVPQSHGAVTHVGAPYHCRFGDNFEPRVLLLKGDREIDLHFDCPRKFSLTVHDADDIFNSKELRPHDQVKLTIEMAREEAVEWQAIKQRVLAACRDCELEVFGAELQVKTTARRERVKLAEAVTTPKDILAAFCKHENVASNIKAAGEEILG